MSQEKFKARAEATINMLRQSKLDSVSKLSLIELIESTHAATDHLTTDAKIQLMAENQFTMSNILAVMLVSRTGNCNLYSMIAKMRWQIVIIVAMLSILILAHPQLIAALDAIFR